MNYYLDMLKQTVDFIEENLENEISAEQVRQKTYYSYKQLNRIFKNYCSVNIGEYIYKRRLSKAAKELLKNNNIAVVANKFQYETPAFTNAFKNAFGITPSEYIKNPKQVNLFQTFDANKYIELEKEIYQTLDKLKDCGIWDYKEKHIDKIEISNINFKELYKIFANSLRIPLPLQLLEHICNTAKNQEEYEDLLLAILPIMYIEYERNNYDITKMSWEIKLPDESERIEFLYEHIKSCCDLKRCEVDENYVVWFGVRRDIFGLMKSKSIYEEKYSYEVNKDEMGWLLEACENLDLVTSYSSKNNNLLDEEKLYIEFKATKLIKFINEMGDKIIIPRIHMDKLNNVDSKAILLLMNKQRLECLEKEISETSFEVDELIIKMFLIKKYYGLDNPVNDRDNYIYEVDKNIYMILQALCEIEEVTSETIGLSYRILRQEDEIKFYLNDVFINFIQEYEFEEFINSQ
ncbi:helix-turn-helix transcriptional regulator [Clostridium sp. DJ247]|uniref:helix-turn-helix transcriptional regulator n=1 Tax=Clostridium sp. DJ247 TaxID=2726188 RepID=UPI0016262703|nr:AraC family transcriptional regulator [Clostridium sp. DJ247]MBC2582285.1 helix-turn-helix transcriptional regulator [Clostridium sp. DJ247]